MVSVALAGRPLHLLLPAVAPRGAPSAWRPPIRPRPERPERARRARARTRRARRSCALAEEQASPLRDAAGGMCNAYEDAPQGMHAEWAADGRKMITEASNRAIDFDWENSERDVGSPDILVETQRWCRRAGLGGRTAGGSRLSHAFQRARSARGRGPRDWNGRECGQEGKGGRISGPIGGK
ncbi:hypothetical protein OH77DRAFT_445560 [Trametes cingulata]|nr:hypothetical protein OH77DRAFT_445560 [Trametes cingulata]